MGAAKARAIVARTCAPLLFTGSVAAAGCTAVLGYPDRVALDQLPDGGAPDSAPVTTDSGGLDGTTPEAARDGGHCTALGACPVAAYDFDEGTGVFARDSSGNANDGTLSGVTWAMGKLGSAASFDGNNVYVTVPNTASIDLSGSQLTLAFWVFVVDDVLHDQVIFGKPWMDGTQGVPPYQYGVEFDHDAKGFDFFLGMSAGGGGGTSSYKMSMPSGPTGTWTHVAFTYDGAMMRGYLNGIMSAQQTATGSFVTRGTNLRMGVDSAGGQGFKGRLDAVRIYAKALTAAEIAALHDGT